MTIAPDTHRPVRPAGAVVPMRPLDAAAPLRPHAVPGDNPPPAAGPEADLRFATYLESIAIAAECDGCPDRSRRLRQAAGILRRSADPAPPAGAGPVADGAMAVLTRRQREVADGVARGLTNRQIAGELGISERTAESHVKNILIKLGYAARTQIAALVGRGEMPDAGHAQQRLTAMAGWLS